MYDPPVTPLLILNALRMSFFNPFRRAQKEAETGQIVIQVKWGREKWVSPLVFPISSPSDSTPLKKRANQPSTINDEDGDERE